MRLQHKLILLITLYILLFITVTTIYFTHAQKNIMVKNLEDRASTLLKIMSVSTSTQLFWSNYEKLNYYAQRIKENLSVNAVIIIDKEGKVLAHSDSSRIGEMVSLQPDFKVLESTGVLKKYLHGPSPTFTISYPIFVVDQIVGYIILKYDMRQVEREIKQIFQRGFWLAALLGLIGILLAISTGYRITKPIHQVMEGMERIRREEYDFKIDVESVAAEEFKTLATAFNNMGSKLKYTIKRLDQERRQSEAIVTSITDGLMIIGTDHRIVYYNKGAEHILGYTRNEALGKKCREIFKSPQCTEANCSLFASDGQITCGDRHSDIQDERISLVSKHGKNLVILKSTAPLIDSNNEIYGGVEVFKDITSLLAMENKLKESDRLASVGVLAAGVAHEINNPLTGITGIAHGLLKRYKSDPVLLEDLTMIKEQGERCGSIIKNLLNLSMKAPETMAAIDINPLLHGVVRIITKTTPDIHMQIVENYDPSSPKVKGDEVQIIQVFTNIIRNAIAATGGKGVLRISTKVVGSRVVIAFEDNGEGISQLNINRVCDPFFTTKKMGEGLGLGLSLSYGIIANYGGELKVESKLGQGSCFTVILDLHGSADEPMVASASTVGEPTKVN